MVRGRAKGLYATMPLSINNYQLPEGYKQTEVGVIPEDWEVSELIDLCETVVDCAHSTPVWTNSGAIVLRNQNIRDGKLDLSEPSYTDEIHFVERTRRATPQEKDLVITREAPMGEVCLIPSDLRCCLGQRMVLLRPNKERCVPEYLLYELQSKQIQQFIRVNGGTGSTVGNLRIPLIEAMPIPLAPPKEQCAIAQALSDVDALIAALDKLIAKQRHLKTATMQQLLTGKKRLPGFGGGIDNGQLRIDNDGSSEKSDGNCQLSINNYQLPKGYKQTEVGVIPDDWEVESIASLASITTGAKNTQDRVEDGQYPFFVRSQTVERINSYSFDGEAVLTAGDGVGTGKVFHYINGKFDVHQRVYRISDFKPELDGFFFYTYFSNRFYDRIASMTAKSSVDSVRMEMIADMLVPLPSSEEQRAIATVLSDMDGAIAALEARRAKTQAIKQGMMQELLTGRTRLV